MGANMTDTRDRFLGALRQAPVVMGILNVTPDSFSDGGRHFAPDDAVAHARAMVAEGAAILDVGGESSRPRHTPISAGEELARVTPVLSAISTLDIPISIDTWKAEVAREATRLGAAIINDIWGLQRDPDMAATVAETSAAVVIMHNRAEADPAIDIIDDMRRFFDRSLGLAAKAGIPTAHILIDPGIGFGKTFEQNLTAIRRLGALADYGLPVLLGLSRKRFIGQITGADTGNRLSGTLAANLAGLARGARVLRVHDVAPHVEAIKIHLAVEAAP
jgi:dihydropteroate synthase